MRIIRQYSLLVQNMCAIAMPLNAAVMSAGCVRSVTEAGEIVRNVCVWVDIDPEAPIQKRVFHLVTTGEEITAHHGAFINTVIMDDIGVIVHVFDTGRYIE